MRHINPTSTSCVSFRCGRRVYSPYNKQYIESYRNTQFAYANPNKTYVKVLQYIADHDGCKRVDVNINVLGWKKHADIYGVKRTAKYSRGQHSSMYSQLLYLDLIDYDKDFCYHITSKGREVLKTAYLNSMEKFVKGK